MTMLQQMTESLFAETLKRLAEEVWGKKFKEAADAIKSSSYTGQSAVKEMITNAFIECLKKDPELKKALENAICQAAREYFKLKVS